MITAVTLFESPIDAMYVIHHALRAEAARVEQVAGQLLEGSTSQPFRHAFYRWTMALAYHADTEDAYMTARFPDTPAARECELAHQRLADRLEAVQHCLTAVSAGTSEGEPGCPEHAPDHHQTQEDGSKAPSLPARVDVSAEIHSTLKAPTS